MTMLQTDPPNDNINRAFAALAALGALNHDDLRRVLAAFAAESPPAASPPGGVRPMSWPDFTAELLTLYHISMRARTTKRGMVQALGSLTALGATSTTDLTVPLLARWVAAQKPTLSPNSVKGKMRYIQRIANYATAQGYLGLNPFVVAPLRTWVRSVPTKGKKFHTREEIGRVLAEMRRLIDTSTGWTQWRWRRAYAMTATLAALGLRANECYRLHVVDIDLTLRIVHIVARTSRLKTASSEADLPLPPFLVPILTEWLEHRMDAPPDFVMDANCPYLWPATRRKAPWTSGVKGAKPRDVLALTGIAVGVPGFTPLSLRHSFATNLTALGAGPNLVRQLLRHTTNATQAWYVHPSLDILREGVEGIGF
jgi:integrase